MKNKKNSPNSDEKNVTDTELTFGALLRRPYVYLQGQVYSELAATGYADIRPAHSAVFRHIRPRGSRITELAEEAQMTKQSMGALVDYLEERGYVQLRPDPTDARAKIVCLTERGQELQRTALQISREAEQQLAVQIGEAEIHRLRELLIRLYHALTQT